MNSILKVAVMLTAYDQMSQTIEGAVGKSKKSLDGLEAHARGLFAKGAGLMGAGAEGLLAINKTLEAYGDLEEAQLSFKSVMMTDAGLNTKMFDDISKVAERLGNKLPGTTEDFYNMFTIMIRSGVDAQSILDGVGESAAYLSVALKMPYEEAGRLSAKLKEAAGIDSDQMIEFMDVIARTSQLGVEAGEMQYAFSRSAGSLKSFGIQGLEASKSLSALFAMLIKSGASGETVGTGMTSIFNAISDPAKLDKFNTALSQYGVQMEFFDKKGNFMGVENFMSQMEKLKKLGLSDVAQGSLVQGLLGPGGDANFFKLLMDQGAKGFGQMTKNMSTQASLNEKVNSQLGGLKAKWEATSGTFTNMLAALGERLAPAMIKIVDLLGKAAGWIQEFVKNNPRLAEFILLMTAAVSAGLMLAGLFFIVKGLIILFGSLAAVILANPLFWIPIAIAAVALAVYVWWDKIVAFFKNNWRKILNFFIAVNPIAWVIIALWKLWTWLDAKFNLGAKFKKIWNDVLQESIKFLSFLLDVFIKIHAPFFNAGKNIGKAIWEGIKSMAHKPVEALKSMVQNMRDLLPFSPAKTGPFKDLHKIKIVETIAASIRAQPMVGAMRNAVGAVGAISAPGVRGGRGSIVINYNPVIHMGAGSSKSDFMAMLNQHKDELMRMIKQETAAKGRTAF